MLLSQRNLIQRRTFHTFLLVVVNCDVYAILVHGVGVGAAVCKANCNVTFLSLLDTGDSNLYNINVRSSLDIDEVNTVIGVDQNVACVLGGTASTIILQGYILRTSPSLVYGGLVVVLAVSALVRIGGHVSILVVGTSAGVLAVINNYCNANGLDTVGLLGSVSNLRTVTGLPVVYSLTGQNLNVVTNAVGCRAVQSEYYCIIADGEVVDLVAAGDVARLQVYSRLVASLVTRTQSLQGVGAVATGRVGVQLVNIIGINVVGRAIYIRLVSASGQRQLLNLDGLGGTVQEVSLYLLSGGTLHAGRSALVVGYNQERR